MSSSVMPHVDNSTMLAVERTRLAHERTLIAWLRTAISMISFGFTIYKFFQAQADQGAAASARRLLGPREFALVMIGIGLVALVLAAVQHHQSMTRLRAESDHVTVPISIGMVVAVLFSLLGVLAFVAVLFRG
jgi:putative membrane protein